MKETDGAQGSDEALIRSLAEGDMTALRTLYIRHGAMVEKSIRRFAPESTENDWDELIQDVFLALKDSAKHYSEQDRFSAWLYGIAVKKARNWQRSTWVRRKLLGQHHGVPVGLAHTGNRSPEHMVSLREQLEQVLNLLPKNQRDVLILHEIEGFKADEIAKILGIRANAVWTRLHRARQKLLETFGPHTLDNHSVAGGAS